MRWVRSERCAKDSCTIIGTEIVPCVILLDWWRGAIRNRMPSGRTPLFARAWWTIREISGLQTLEFPGRGSETFLQGVRVVGPDVAEQPTGPRPATSTPYQPVRDHGGCNMSTPRQPPTLPTCLDIPDTCTPLRRAPQENRQGYRRAAPIQRFNNKSLNWLSWFWHFQAVADVHGWDDNQRALQLVSRWDSYECSAGAGWWWTV